MDRLSDGPFVCGINAKNDYFRFYKSGTLASSDIQGVGTDFGHAVVIVGRYKDEWIIQNSWGTSWGDDGFIRLAVEEGDGVLNLNKYCAYMTVV